MKICVLSFFLLFSIAGISQVWVDANAQWNYKILSATNPGYYEYQYTQDTLIQGHMCQKITGTRHQWYWDGTDWVAMAPFTPTHKYTYVNGDTVFHFFNDQFFVALNFGAAIGDQWLITDTNAYNPGTNCNDSASVEVIDTGSISINSISYRTITLQTLDSSSYALNGLFVERFGFMPDSLPSRMLPVPQSCDPSFIIQPWYLRFSCFQDDSFPVYNPSGNDCQFIPGTAGVQESENELFSFYPNPAADYLQVNTVSEGGILKIYDALGRELKVVAIQENCNVNISDLSEGTYYLLFSTGPANADVQTFVVRR